MKGIICGVLAVLGYIGIIIIVINGDQKQTNIPVDNAVNINTPIMLDIAGNKLYIIPVDIKNNSMCYIAGAKTDTPSFVCDFIREKNGNKN
jgi:hypothetical protein